jgi:hypothetical protein
MTSLVRNGDAMTFAGAHYVWVLREPAIHWGIGLPLKEWTIGVSVAPRWSSIKGAEMYEQRQRDRVYAVDRVARRRRIQLGI